MALLPSELFSIILIEGVTRIKQMLRGSGVVNVSETIDPMLSTRLLAGMAGARGKRYEVQWVSAQSKTPHHLRFGADGKVAYMRDGILTTTNGHSGSYRRVKEFDGESRDQQAVEISIGCDVFDGETQLEPMTA
jgi:hypothetical protein